MLTNLVAIACLKYFPRATFATGATSVRHPSYAGLLLLAVGVGLCFGNAASLGVIVVPMIALVLKRIEVEEDALVHTLGDSYRAYARRTKRLIPGLY